MKTSRLAFLSISFMFAAILTDRLPAQSFIEAREGQPRSCIHSDHQKGGGHRGIDGSSGYIQESTCRCYQNFSPDDSAMIRALKPASSPPDWLRRRVSDPNDKLYYWFPDDSKDTVSGVYPAAIPSDLPRSNPEGVSAVAERLIKNASTKPSVPLDYKDAQLPRPNPERLSAVAERLIKNSSAKPSVPLAYNDAEWK